MAPTLKDGNYVLILRLGYKLLLRRGCIVIVKHYTRPNFLFIKRLVGLPGDKIITYLDEVYSPLHASQVIRQRYTNSNCTWDIASGYCFVKGDAPVHSEDSVIWGPIALESVVGVILFKLPDWMVASRRTA